MNLIGARKFSSYMRGCKTTLVHDVRPLFDVVRDNCSASLGKHIDSKQLPS